MLPRNYFRHFFTVDTKISFSPVHEKCISLLQFICHCFFTYTRKIIGKFRDSIVFLPKMFTFFLKMSKTFHILRKKCKIRNFPMIFPVCVTSIMSVNKCKNLCGELKCENCKITFYLLGAESSYNIGMHLAIYLGEIPYNNPSPVL